MKFPKLHRYLLKQYKFWYNKTIFKKPRKDIDCKLIDKFIINVEIYGSRRMISIWYKVKNNEYSLYYSGRPMMYSIKLGAFLSVKKYLKIIRDFLDDLFKLNNIKPKIEIRDETSSPTDIINDVSQDSNLDINTSVVKVREPLVSKFLEPKRYKSNVSKPVVKFVADASSGEVSLGGDI